MNINDFSFKILYKIRRKDSHKLRQNKIIVIVILKNSFDSIFVFFSRDTFCRNINKRNIKFLRQFSQIFIIPNYCENIKIK